ncbi:hypothetical protein [Parafilimonas sp.]|uniref:hypothetical protein n=1 Tax=Parafilimonas sp. TaxID=1969739 RepID=UPI0039E31E8C
MKNYFMAIATALFLLLLTGCNKDGGSSGDGSAIETLADAMAAYSKITDIWNDELRPQLATDDQTFTNFVINGESGTAIVNGKYSEINQSSSNTSYNEFNMSVTVDFKDYTGKNGAKLSGGLHFYELSDTRCTNFTCATHSSYQYYSLTQDNTVLPVAISFLENGKKYSDKVYIDADKASGRLSWDISLLNGKQEKFSW